MFFLAVTKIIEAPTSDTFEEPSENRRARARRLVLMLEETQRVEARAIRLQCLSNVAEPGYSPGA